MKGRLFERFCVFIDSVLPHLPLEPQQREGAVSLQADLPFIGAPPAGECVDLQLFFFFYQFWKQQIYGDTPGWEKHLLKHKC